VHHDLSRACVVTSADPFPRIVVIGRLSLYGRQAARLHDELITVTARWQAPDSRRGPLKPYAEDTHAKTLDLLEEALADRTHPIADTVFQQLRQSIQQDVRDLLPHLEGLAGEAQAAAEAKLGLRGTKEAGDMQEILEAQIKRISRELAAKDGGQLALGFMADEVRQLEEDKKHWRRRLEAMQQELQTEPARIRDGYVVQASRIEPVGVVYLWPSSG
jgi:hypothetical protein